MAIRTYAELLAAFATNTTGDIGADDLRDFLDTVYAPKTERIHCTIFAETTGPNAPDPSTIGAVAYYDFSVNDELWLHATLPGDIDVTQDIIVHVDWAPTAAEAGRTVSGQLEYVVVDGAPTIDTIDGTLLITDAPVPVSQWEDIGSTFTIPAAQINTGDHEVHFKLTRTPSSNDPATIALHHVWLEVTVVKQP